MASGAQIDQHLPGHGQILGSVLLGIRSDYALARYGHGHGNEPGFPDGAWIANRVNQDQMEPARSESRPGYHFDTRAYRSIYRSWHRKAYAFGSAEIVIDHLGLGRGLSTKWKKSDDLEKLSGQRAVNFD